MRVFLKKIIDFISPYVPGAIKKPLRNWYIFLFFGAQKLEKDTFDRQPIIFPKKENYIKPAKNRPLVSIIIISYNNWTLTKNCIDSIMTYSYYPNIEIIVVDNNSDNQTKDSLKELAKTNNLIKTIFNQDNKGFAAANNQGVKIANGEYIVYLNNDTIVTPGWIDGLLHHFEDGGKIGLVGPATSYASTIQMLLADYYDINGLLAYAQNINQTKSGSSKKMNMVPLFCVMSPLKVVEEVGGISEEYGVGYFEDDDLCRRVTALGYEILFAEDVFVHHIGGASFDKIGFASNRDLFLRNKKIYEEKWGEWEPPGKR